METAGPRPDQSGDCGTRGGENPRSLGSSDGMAGQCEPGEYVWKRVSSVTSTANRLGSRTQARRPANIGSRKAFAAAVTSASVAHASPSSRAIASYGTAQAAGGGGSPQARGASCGLELREHVVGRTAEAQIDVPGGSCAREAQFEDESALERRAVAEDCDYARKEAIEDEQLAAAREVSAGLRGRAEPRLPRLLERFG